MESSGEGPAGLHVLVEMRDVGSDDHPAARCVDARKLQPGRMPAGGVQLDAGREFSVAVVELDAPRSIERLRRCAPNCRRCSPLALA
jgi:hypothetical protein